MFSSCPPCCHLFFPGSLESPLLFSRLPSLNLIDLSFLFLGFSHQQVGKGDAAIYLCLGAVFGDGRGDGDSQRTRSYCTADQRPCLNLWQSSLSSACDIVNQLVFGPPLPSLPCRGCSLTDRICSPKPFSQTLVSRASGWKGKLRLD